MPFDVSNAPFTDQEAIIIKGHFGFVKIYLMTSSSILKT